VCNERQLLALNRIIAKKAKKLQALDEFSLHSALKNAEKELYYTCNKQIT